MSSLIAWIMRAIPFGTIIMYGAMGETITPFPPSAFLLPWSAPWWPRPWAG